MSITQLICIGIFGAITSNVWTEEALANQTAVEQNLRIEVRFDDELVTTHRVEDRLRYHNVPGFSFALIDDGEIAWTAGYGTRDLGSGKPTTANTLFQAASIAKPMTVVAALRIRDAGAIDLDRDISAYLDEYVLPKGKQTPDAPVTFRNILAHTSGITPGGYLGFPRGMHMPTNRQVLDGNAPDTPAIQVIALPGARLAYSGGGYTLAEFALEAALGKSFEDIMHKWLFKPLSLERSTFALTPVHEDIALGHASDRSGIDNGWLNHPRAAAGLWTTTPELARILLELHLAYHGKSEFLSKDTARELVREQIDNHAFGFVLAGENANISVRHLGANQGYRAVAMLFPETGDGAVFLSNSDNGFQLSSEMFKAVANVYDWPYPKQRVMSRFALNELRLRAFVGVYRFETGWQMEISYSPREKAIAAVFPNGDRYDLVPTANGRFVYPLNGVTFHFSEREQTVLLYGQTGHRI